MAGLIANCKTGNANCKSNGAIDLPENKVPPGGGDLLDGRDLRGTLTCTLAAG